MVIKEALFELNLLATDLVGFMACETDIKKRDSIHRTITAIDMGIKALELQKEMDECESCKIGVN